MSRTADHAEHGAAAFIPAPARRFCNHEETATSARPGALIDCYSEAVADRSGSGGLVAAWATMQERRWGR
jgi:hypothetical protein